MDEVITDPGGGEAHAPPWAIFFGGAAALIRPARFSKTRW